MLNRPIKIIHEERPIERRGKKRASPLIEMSLSYQEEVVANLMELQQFGGENPNFSGEFNIEFAMLILVTSLGSLRRQTNFKRQNKQ